MSHFDRPERTAGFPHICLFPGQLQLGGIGRNMINLAEELLSRGVRVDFFLSKRAGVYVPQIPKEARIVEGAGTVKSSVPRLIRYLRNEQPHMLVSARPYINLAAIVSAELARVRTKVVITERAAPLTHTKERGGIGQRIINIGCRALYPRAAHIIAVSQSVADELTQILGKTHKPIQVIYNPVATRRVLEKSKEPVRDDWIEASAAPIVIGVGRLTFQKDFPTLIKAFADVRRQREVRLVILGEGEDREALERLVRELGLESDVHLPGYVDNPYAYMARAAVFVLSSRWEGLPTVLIESLTVGTPVVSTDCPGGSAEILAEGEFGELVPIGEVRAMAGSIRAILDGPPRADRLQERSGRFSAATAVDQYLNLLGR
jgi:glycosyltransferase involved in cell wall biosynthesis